MEEKYRLEVERDQFKEKRNTKKRQQIKININKTLP